MSKYIALFRGINVGGHNKLPMKDLVRILEGLGCGEVKTYIQSGNVVFRASEEPSADAISNAVDSEFGFRPNVMLLTGRALREAVEANPFPTDEGKLLHFMFLKEPPSAPDVEKLESVKAPSEQYVLTDRVFYLYTPDGFGRSKLAERVERCLGVPLTARNLNTVNAILGML